MDFCTYFQQGGRKTEEPLAVVVDQEFTDFPVASERQARVSCDEKCVNYMPFLYIDCVILCWIMGRKRNLDEPLDIMRPEFQKLVVPDVPTFAPEATFIPIMSNVMEKLDKHRAAGVKNFRKLIFILNTCVKDCHYLPSPIDQEKCTAECKGKIKNPKELDDNDL